MKIGDKKPELKIVSATTNIKAAVLAAYDKLEHDEEERRLLELAKRQREVNERAKRRF